MSGLLFVSYVWNYSGTSGIRPPGIRPPLLSDHVLLNKKCFVILKFTSSIRPPPLYNSFFSKILEGLIPEVPLYQLSIIHLLSSNADDDG